MTQVSENVRASSNLSAMIAVGPSFERLSSEESHAVSFDENLVMAERSRDWFRQAEADLRHARNACHDADYEWAAFASHQAAEKAVKAVFQKLHLDAWGHALSLLMTELPAEVGADEALIDRAKELDKHYIPTRYPNGFERGAPVDFYTRKEAEQAIGNAEAILEFCRHQIDR